MIRRLLKLADLGKMSSFMVTQTELVVYIWRIVHLKRTLTKSIQKRLLKRIRKLLEQPRAITKIGITVHHQKMKGVESGLGNIGIEAVVQIAVIHQLIIEIDIILGQKGERMNRLERKAVAAEDTQNIISRGEAGILRQNLDMIAKESMENPREIDAKGGIDSTKKVLFP